MENPKKIRPHLVLIGFRGTGKSTLSEIVAENLGLKRISTDERVTEKLHQSGIADIAECVTKQGWKRFREIESETIREIVEQAQQKRKMPEDRLILDSGGGVVENDANMRLLGEIGRIVWVHADLDDVLRRLLQNPHDAQRPLLEDGKSQAQDIADNFTRRLPIYERYAEFSINTSQLSIDEACGEIIRWVRNR